MMTVIILTVGTYFCELQVHALENVCGVIDQSLVPVSSRQATVDCCKDMGQKQTKILGFHIDVINGYMNGMFEQMIRHGHADIPEIGRSVIGCAMKTMLDAYPSLCVPDFLFPRDNVTTKFDFITLDGVPWKDVMSVKSGLHSVMTLQFRMPDTLDRNFEMPFKWHILYIGDDKQSFNISGQDVVIINIV